MKNKDKIIYWIATGLLSAMVLMGAAMYFLQNEMVSEVFSQLGYPVYLVYPLAIAKILAIIAILSKKSKLLKDLAYAGLFYVLILGGFAHLLANEGSPVPAFAVLALLIVSYIYDKKLFLNK